MYPLNCAKISATVLNVLFTTSMEKKGNPAQMFDLLEIVKYWYSVLKVVKRLYTIREDNRLKKLTTTKDKGYF
jgi:hypothetical protein